MSEHSNDQMALVRALGRIEGKLDTLVSSIGEASAHRSELDARLRDMEDFGSRLKGAVAVASSIGGIVGASAALLISSLV